MTANSEHSSEARALGEAPTGQASKVTDVEVLVVGAGISGLYAAFRLRMLGIDFQGVEAGSDVGGTWFWNRYPGCRCDIPSVEYSYAFDPTMEQEWSFTENMASQPEIERYLNHVADRHSLRLHFRFGIRVISARYKEEEHRWTIETDNGDIYNARWCILAIGVLSAANFPPIAGLDEFQGRLLHTGLWPSRDVDLRGLRVGIIGTGSSGIQAIPQIAKVARCLTVFQRTPSYALPGNLTPMDKRFETIVKSHYREIRRMQRASTLGISGFTTPVGLGEAAEAVGTGALQDLRNLVDPVINRRLCDSYAQMVRSRVKDPKAAEMLIPKGYPFGCKRLVLEIDYFETYNRDNVRLIDVTQDAITEITPRGVRTQREECDLDVLIFATGFDAFSGPAAGIDIVCGDKTLKSKWVRGPRAYLGIMSSGFPNLFFVHGPGSPSVLSNMVIASEQQVDLICEIVRRLRDRAISEIDAAEGAEADWIDHVRDVAAGTQYTAPSCRSWYLGSNIDGKARNFVPYAGGFDQYQRLCNEAITANFRGFNLR